MRVSEQQSVQHARQQADLAVFYATTILCALGALILPLAG